MQAQARVLAVRDGRVQLECESTATGTCGACAGGRGCALRWVAGRGNTLLELTDPAHGDQPLRAGDGVTLEVDDGELLRAAALAYVPPLVGLLAGSGLGVAWVPGSESAAMAGAVVGLAAGWVGARAWLRRFPPRYRVRVAGQA